ncbi:hypothetical protein [Roseofilum casamattae]|uniref:Uncharacterized protein n=1 Tax=Roseofilum casamattae BLCC-M143 TaxID=3022442 RepID=A0ABT7BYN6_9CYAN|nr:hypothetical protein [Roseofilum casamattae]MDJ1184322.1 hypothetical protein [Roseofilum casamattae BLCC-M143]
MSGLDKLDSNVIAAIDNLSEALKVANQQSDKPNNIVVISIKKKPAPSFGLVDNNQINYCPDGEEPYEVSPGVIICRPKE